MARAQDREEIPANAEPEAETPHNRIKAAEGPVVGRARDPVKVPDVVKEEARAAVEMRK